MKNKDYCHLHVHNEYSQLDGFGTATGYARKAAKLGFKYLGLTNHGNIDGLIRFQDACRAEDIIPILGCEGYIVPDSRLKTKSRKNGHITIFVKNQKGFKNLCKLLTFANLDGFYYRPRFTYSQLLKNCDGLIIGTACMMSWTDAFKSGVKFFNKLYEEIGDNLYCEVMPIKSEKQKKHNRNMIKLAKRTGLKVFASNDCHYINRSEWKSQEILLAIQQKRKWNDPKRWKFSYKNLHLRSQKEMQSALEKIGFYKKEYLQNTLEIAERCSNYIIPKQRVQLPRVKGLGTLKEDKFLEDKCAENFKKLFDQSLYDHRLYYERFEHEFKLIKSKKFTRYFLIVWEFVQWCKENKILIGPGRGSVGCSLIAYLLEITIVDPIKYNLAFERFISADRIDQPDIDIDIEYSKRDLAKQHLATLYGEDKVANVSSFQHMKSKAVIRDVSRVFSIPDSEVDRFAKLIDANAEDAIQDCIDKYYEAEEFYEKYPNVVKQAKKLEGQVRGYSQHAAAVVLSKTPIADSGRCNLIKRKDVILVNWEKEDTEYVGLMKLDALGLKLLSVLSEAKRLIKKNHEKNIEFEALNLEDKSVFKELTKGYTTGIFQISGYATSSLVNEMGINRFMDISDAVALSRPGPAHSGMTKEYVLRKHGADWEKVHRVYDKITEDTYGLLVYQEQVMQIIHEIAGLPYSTADKIRKIIGKKRDPREFMKYKKQFVRGCKKEGIFSGEQAEEFWEGLQEWAYYGFNKAHAVEYAILAYWCSWLKKYFPTEFISASLTHGSKEKKGDLVEEAYRLGLSLVLPKVGISEPIKWVAKDTKLYIPFIEVKGIGKVKAYEAAASPNKKEGITKFYSKKSKEAKQQHHAGALGKLLNEINAYSDTNETQITDKVKNKFDFRIVTNPRENYRRLYEIYDNKIRLDRLDKILEGDRKLLSALSKKKKIITRRSFRGFKNLLSCTKCSLHKECTRPVPPSPGRYNIVIVGQDPGFEEDKDGRGFVGRSGKEVWKYVKKKGYTRKMFHVSNINKCWPQYSKKSNKQQIKTCSETWFKKELKRVKPKVILAFGASALYFFTGKTGGITDISGRVQWNEDYGAWIVWCLHPAATLHNPESRHYFDRGMASFCKLLRALDLK
jgi:DNA polymerase-3 subunit alpha